MIHIDHHSRQTRDTLNLSPEKEADVHVAKLIVVYPHRRNQDGSYDSICLNCQTTITTGKSEAELWKHDKNHICKPSLLSQRPFEAPRWRR